MQPNIGQHASIRALIALALLIVLLIVGTIGYREIEGMTTVDAAYMAVITLSTVGFGEITPLSEAGRIFTIGLIMGGAGLAAYAFTNVATFMMSGEWRAYWDQRRHTRMLAHLEDHIIVCGYGRVGRHVARGLRADGLPFVVIDSSLEKIARVQAAGYLAIHGNAAIDADLKAAGIDRARGLAAAVNSDAENVFIVLTARGLNPNLLILARANYEDSESKLLRAGADHVILPYSIAGRRISTLLARPHVADFLDEVTHAAGLELLLEQIELPPRSPFVGQTLAQAALEQQFGFVVLAYKPPDGQLITRPGGDTLLEARAHIIALGTREQLQTLISAAEG